MADRMNTVPTRSVEIRDALISVEAELARAMEDHTSLNSAHEAYAVILEELDEFWEEVRKKRELRDPTAMRTELIQVAAMAIRTIHDVVERP